MIWVKSLSGIVLQNLKEKLNKMHFLKVVCNAHTFECMGRIVSVKIIWIRILSCLFCDYIKSKDNGGSRKSRELGGHWVHSQSFWATASHSNFISIGWIQLLMGKHFIFWASYINLFLCITLSLFNDANSSFSFLTMQTLILLNRL